MDYCIVIPAHNEEGFLSLTLDSILRQTLLPQQVVVVNDNSTDNTAGIIDGFIMKNNLFDRVDIVSSTEHVPGSKVINAFNKGLEKIKSDFDFIVKLDADVILPEYYFEKVAFLFKTNPKAGIVGGFAYEKDDSGVWALHHPMDKDHVRGAFKSYSKPCFMAIGGLKTAMGWDTVDELLARYNGFEIKTDATLQVKHLRPTGNAYNKKAKCLQGKAMYTMRYGLVITCIASLKMAWKQKGLRVFLHNLQGFLNAMQQKAAFIVTVEEGKFIRKLRWDNIYSKLF